MSIYDDELIKDLLQSDLKKYFKKIEDPESFINLIEQNFEFSGSQIDWFKTDNHYSKESNNKSLLSDARLFIAELKEKYMNNNIPLMYIGDNLTEFGYQFEIKDIEKILVFFLDIPQHHYFIPLEGDWCLGISYENYLDFGFSLNRS
ncbi:rhs-associated protein [Bacillus carboniphilus]|uniref:Rhs-associated protein n=1 Tax=Bacillus carboniphilus TaxID=86663 RepID=A0ABY9JSZ5_9BACI|nr:rhs-associated protein [Bacillus carboniphilus]WLR42517.1 rhs-associated protein [Bacillus carboniphilus]